MIPRVNEVGTVSKSADEEMGAERRLSSCSSSLVSEEARFGAPAVCNDSAVSILVLFPWDLIHWSPKLTANARIYRSPLATSCESSTGEISVYFEFNF